MGSFFGGFLYASLCAFCWSHPSLPGVSRGSPPVTTGSTERAPVFIVCAAGSQAVRVCFFLCVACVYCIVPWGICFSKGPLLSTSDLDLNSLVVPAAAPNEANHVFADSILAVRNESGSTASNHANPSFTPFLRAKRAARALRQVELSTNKRSHPDIAQIGCTWKCLRSHTAHTVSNISAGHDRRRTVCQR